MAMNGLGQAMVDTDTVFFDRGNVESFLMGMNQSQKEMDSEYT
jgi:hypothetical protein